MDERRCPVPAQAQACYASLHQIKSKERSKMEVSARLSSKGQLTVPRAVREALSLEEGDAVVFRVEGKRAIIARSPDLLAMAGSVSVPAAKRGTPWHEVLQRTRQARGAERR
jgi:antitoxin PrlF